MKKKRKLFLTLCITVIILGIMSPKSLVVSEAKPSKKTYEIAVVYDNSGSMYADGTKGIDLWCRAKYAMETFASMMNYENGDVLKVFPMHKVKIEGKMVSSFSVKKTGEIKKIHDFYTPIAAVTPFKTVENAYEGLKKSKADNRWLIVLTDGDFDSMSKEQVEKALKNMSKKVKVQYLGIGHGSKKLSGNGKNFLTDKVTDSKQLTNSLTKICNRIFERDELPKDALRGKELKLNISMSKIFVFVQGDKAKIGSLKNADGKEVKPISQYSITASDTAVGRSSDGTWGKDIKKSKKPKDLKGATASFQNCSSGTYILNYSGDSKNIQIFYEPNVEAFIKVLDADGKHEYTVEELSDEMEPGKYKIVYGVTDKVTGKEITKSPLLAPVNIKGRLTENGKKSIFLSGDTIELKAGADIDIEVSGTYLKDYKISSKDSEKYKLPNLKIGQAEVGVEITKGQNAFVLGKQKNWKAYQVSITQGGKKVSDEVLEKAKVDFTFSTDVKCNYKVLKGESAYEVYIGQDKNGKMVEPEAGKGTFTVAITLSGRSGKDSVSYNISLPSKDELKVSIARSTDKFALSQREKWEPYIVKVTKNGKVLSDKEMSSLQPNFSFSNGEKFAYEMVEGKSQYKIYLGKNEDGSLADIKAKKGTFKAEILDKYGREIQGEISRKYIIKRFSDRVAWMIKLSIILLILVLIIFTMTRKALPKDISALKKGKKVTVNGIDDPVATVKVVFTDKTGFPFKKKAMLKITARNIDVGGGTTTDCNAKLNVEATDSLYKRFKSKNRRFRIKQISGGNIEEIAINGRKIKKDDHGKFVLDFNDKSLRGLGNAKIKLKQTYDNGRRISDIEIKCKLNRK